MFLYYFFLLHTITSHISIISYSTANGEHTQHAQHFYKRSDPEVLELSQLLTVVYIGTIYVPQLIPSCCDYHTSLVRSVFKMMQQNTKVRDG